MTATVENNQYRNPASNYPERFVARQSDGPGAVQSFLWFYVHQGVCLDVFFADRLLAQE